jgi:RimJ/RimL family protein N-acetyltransferase
VLDTKTGLVWQRCSLGQSWDGTSCVGHPFSYSWQSAFQAARDQKGGWRLPNVKELHSLIEVACNDPSINETIFPASFSPIHEYWDWEYWTATPSANKKSRAWAISFGSGSNFLGSISLDDQDFYFVRLVRSSQ